MAQGAFSLATLLAMDMRLHLLVAAAFCLFLATTSCGPPVAPDGTASGTIVVGVTSEPRAGVDIDRMRVVLRAGGEVLDDRELSYQGGQLFFPHEFRFEGLEDGTPVEIVLSAFVPGDAATPRLIRTAATTVVGGRELLLRLRLEAECMAPPGGDLCAAPQTCVAGACGDPYLDPRRLEPYTPTWPEDEPDICKPAGAGDAIVVVGKGQGDYLPLDDLEEVQVEAGPQGGHHIWVAIRVKNVRQSGSITEIAGWVPEIEHTLRPFRVIFTFDPDEGGFCKLAGLRFQVDEAIDIHELLGKIMEVKVTVTDPDGQIGTGKRKVTLSRTIL